MTVVERAPLPTRLDTPGRRALLVWPLAALWVRAADTQVAYISAVRAGLAPEQAWQQAWTYIASFGGAPFVVVAVDTLVTAWLTAVVLARRSCAPLGAQVRLAAPAAFGLGAGGCALLLAAIEPASTHRFGPMLVAGALSAAAASAGLPVLRLMDALLPAGPPPGGDDEAP